MVARLQARDKTQNGMNLGRDERLTPSVIARPGSFEYKGIKLAGQSSAVYYKLFLIYWQFFMLFFF